VKKFSPLVVVFFLVRAMAQAQENAEPPAEASGTDDSQIVYVIRKIDFDVKGRSRPFALISNGEFKEGERIQGKDRLEQYIALKQQLLINQRVLEEVSIEYTLGTPEADGAVPVDLLVHVEDTTNFIVLPYPKYDSNDGGSLTLKARDYNFLGTMNALRIDLGVRVDTEEKKSVFNFEIDSDTPFKAAGLNWNLNFDHFFKLTLFDGARQPLYYQNITGLSMELPRGSTTFTLGFNQYLVFNEENSDEAKNVYGLGERFDGPYGGSEIYGSWKIPLGIQVGEFGDLNYTPGVSGRVNYIIENRDEPRKPVASFSHSLGFGRVNWIGNYRKGIEASVSNGYNYYFSRSDAPFAVNLSAGATIHWPFTRLIGLSARIQYRQWWQESDRLKDTVPYYSAGDVLRGVVNDHLQANYMLSFNLDLPFRILRFWPSEWFNYAPLHLFDFEMHVSPFMDLALVKSPDYNFSTRADKKTGFSIDDMIMTGGFEIIVFPGYFRSFYLRGSVGYNITNLINEKRTPDLKWGIFPQWNEIYIGIGHHY
jgi:hypothetical protein